MTQPPAPDWYPDPTGKPGLMYWDGQQWRTDVRATASNPAQPTSQPRAPQPQPPPISPKTGGIDRRTTIALVAGAVSLVAVIVAAVGIVAIVRDRPSESSPTSSSPPSESSPTSSSPTTTSRQRAYGAQIVLPFTVNGPRGVAVDSTGNVYLTDSKQVMRLAAGSSTPTILPLNDLTGAEGVAVDSTGNVYIADCIGPVLEFKVGSSTPTVLPFTDVASCWVAVDSAGTVYGIDYNLQKGNPAFKLPAGASTPVKLPFPPLATGNTTQETGIAVDTAGNIYAARGATHGSVLMLAAGSLAPVELPFTGLGNPMAIAVDNAGGIYVTEYNGRVLKLPAGFPMSTVLPFTGLNMPWGVV
ncbi:MAG: DUF2510 domain-containing protein, partial [Mycobacterium sp.]